MRVRTSTAVTLIPVAVAVNLGIGLLVHALKIPLYLDSIGTVFIGFTLGPLWGALAGIVTMLLGGLLLNPWMPYYAGTAMVVGMLSGIAGRYGWQFSFPKTALLGVILALVAAAVSAPVTVMLFGGVTGSGTTTFVAILRASGRTLVESVLITGFLVEILDKLISALLPWLIIQRMPRTLKLKMPLLRRHLLAQDEAVRLDHQ